MANKPTTAVEIPDALVHMFTDDTVLKQVAIRCQIIDADDHLDLLLQNVVDEFDNIKSMRNSNICATNLEKRVTTGIEYGEKLLETVPCSHAHTFAANTRFEQLKERITRLKRFYEESMKPVIEHQRHMRDDSGAEDVADDSDAIFSDSDVDCKKYDDPVNKMSGMRVLSDDE